tara:strand:- start:65 stop:1501 length:1437 start_codon:yes stop_codon:yes gene_type:complete
MIGRLFGKSAESIESLSEATPIDRRALETFEHIVPGQGKKIKNLGDAAAQLRQAVDQSDRNICDVLFQTAQMSKGLEGRPLKQLSLVMSKTLNDEEKSEFLGDAAHVGATGLVSTMIEQKDPVACAPETLSQMAERANKAQRYETFSALKAHGAEHENSLFYMVVKSGDFPAAREQLAAGVDPTGRNENGNTVLHATANAHIASLTDQIVKAAGPEMIHARNDDGKSFLSMVLNPLKGNDIDSWGRQRTRNHDVERMIDLAAENGFDFNQPDNNGNTPMHDFAACQRDFSFCDDEIGPRFKIEKKLSEQGIDKMAKNNDGQTAGDIALSRNTMEVSAILAGNGFLPSTEEGIKKVIDGAIKTGQGHAMKQMKEHGVDWVEHLGGPEAAPFEIVLQAAKQESAKPVQMARAAGLSFDVRNEKSETPFSVAREMCNEETLGVLKEIKMDIVSADLQKRAQTKADTRSEKVARRKAQEEVR